MLVCRGRCRSHICCLLRELGRYGLKAEEQDPKDAPSFVIMQRHRSYITKWRRKGGELTISSMRFGRCFRQRRSSLASRNSETSELGEEKIPAKVSDRVQIDRNKTWINELEFKMAESKFKLE